VLATVPGLWLATWVLQVMPLFFYVGGYLHSRSYRPGYVRYRIVGLVATAAPLLVAWAIVGGILALAGGVAWADGTVTFALSPLWFLAVYLGLVALLPLWRRLHARLGIAAVPVLAGLAGVVDALRFGFGVGWLGWLNLLLVWGAAHQAGFHHEALLRAPRRVGWALLGGGVAALCGLLALGYPGSMVGVPGDRWSNMSPPTVAILAVTAIQVGLVRLGSPTLPALLSRPGARRVLAVANRYAMPVFLLHMSGYLLAQAIGWRATGYVAIAVLGTLLARSYVDSSTQRGQVLVDAGGGALHVAGGEQVEEGAAQHGERQGAFRPAGLAGPVPRGLGGGEDVEPVVDGRPREPRPRSVRLDE
jgi:hypothetical protein